RKERVLDDAGVVDEDVGSAEIRRDPFADGLDGRRVPEVGGAGDRLASAPPDLGDCLLGAPRVLFKSDDDTAPGRGQLQGDRAPDPAGAPGDDGGSHRLLRNIRDTSSIAASVPAGAQVTERSIHRVIFVSMSPGPTSRKVRWPSRTIVSTVVFQRVG